jgi:hypothetical protein
MAAASNDDNAFIILGHGTEDVTKWIERPVIPKGYTLITVAECGIVTTIDEVCPMVEAFSKEDHRDIFMNPIRHKKQIEKFMKGKGIHIYTEGKRYPNLALQMFLDWPAEEHVRIFKSGVYPFPIDTKSFQIGEGSTFCDKLFKKIGPYKGFSATMPPDYDVTTHFDGSEIPTVDEVSDILKTTKKSDIIKSKLTIPLEDIFKKCGPGIYYYVICRSPKSVKAPEDLLELNLIPPESINKYKPYLIKNWTAKVNNILPLIEENIKHTNHWIKTELENTRNEYKKLSSVPLVRRLSITQQKSLYPNSVKNNLGHTSYNLKKSNNNSKKSMKTNKNIKGIKTKKNNRNTKRT